MFHVNILIKKIRSAIGRALAQIVGPWWRKENAP
jgi:hypothetical protein